jgi:hypothetical protein
VRSLLHSNHIIKLVLGVHHFLCFPVCCVLNMSLHIHIVLDLVLPILLQLSLQMYSTIKGSVDLSFLLNLLSFNFFFSSSLHANTAYPMLYIFIVHPLANP